jgi:SpoVK/Ycf46/Vps4 family AAA+-type ATPase
MSTELGTEATHETLESRVEDVERLAHSPGFDDLWHAFRRLDQRLERTVVAARDLYGPEAVADPFKGLHITQDEVEGLLGREPGAPLLWTGSEASEDIENELAGEVSGLGWLRQTFGLSSFEVDLILIALAPEIDLRYERLYAYLQNDVTRTRPTVELTLNLLCPSVAEKLVRRGHFDADAPLIRNGLVHLIPDINRPQPPVLAHFLRLDEQIVRLLLGQGGLEARLSTFCEYAEPLVCLDELPLDAETKQALPALVGQARNDGEPLRLYFQGPPGIGKRRTAEAVAFEVAAPLLVGDLTRALEGNADFRDLLHLAFREAWFQGAVLYLAGVDSLQGQKGSSHHQALLDALAENAGITILAGNTPWIPSGDQPTGMMTIPFPMPSFKERRACWQANLSALDIPLKGPDLEALASRFRLTPDQIAEAVAAASNQARWRTLTRARSESSLADERTPALDDLMVAARSQSSPELSRLAHKVEPLYTWNDIVLPADTLAQLQEICQRVTFRHRVFADWGFERKLSLGKGINALFVGPSGTGKTMAAEIIANELGLELYKIDLSGVVSKYIGETEKNLDRIFTAAENANAILFFDEADALFGKRSEASDAHDRYANIEIAYLLQQMEEYDGVAILATNLRRNLDESFVRRLAFTVHFPFPDEDHRRRIWERIWPREMPLADGLDLEFLANRFKLSGGSIKNIALAAAFLAASARGAVTVVHLIQATRREYEKMGKHLNVSELEPLLHAANGRGSLSHG